MAPNLPWTSWVCLLLAIAVCIALALYDYRKLILPDALNAALAALALLFHWSLDWSFLSLSDALWGAAAGGSLFLFLKLFYEYARGRHGLGLGDVKFMIGAGLWVGIWQIPLLVAIASLSTLATIFFLRTANRLSSRTVLHRHFPFGPGLCVALVLLILDMCFRR